MNRIKLMDIEWDEPVEDIVGLQGYDGVRALVRLRGQG
jgi:hypothetical protein